ncbi:hypothetical protein MMC11_004747 [Xylographa trunciseda]|nr:hypothetical protein [Xylographa trunciseda]
MRLHQIARLAIGVGMVTCTPISYKYASDTSIQSIPYPNRPVIEFPLGTWAENLAVRGNGQILVTVLNTPQLLQVDPLSLQEPFLIHQFPNPDKADGVGGIAELAPDVFYIVTGNFTISDLEGTPGTYSVWEVDMNTFSGGENGTIVTPATVNKITDIPGALTANGVIALSKYENALLVADSKLGAVWKVDVKTKVCEVVIKDPLMNASSDPSSLGVNGIKIFDGFLYFTNTQAGTFSRIPIHADGTAAGAAEILKTGILTADDLVFDMAGDAYIASDAGNVLTEVSAKGQVRTVVGNFNSSYLAGATAVQFGRTALDRSVLYVTTNGGQAKPVNGLVAPGKVVAVYTETYAASQAEIVP